MKEGEKAGRDGLNQTDFEILDILKKNAKAKMQDIGDKVHLTGQAVSNRINRLEKLGIIKGYSVIVELPDEEESLTAYIKIRMKTMKHQMFEEWVRRKKEIVEGHRISGDGCYLIKVRVTSRQELTALLDAILEYGNYTLNISVNKIK